MNKLLNEGFTSNGTRASYWFNGGNLVDANGCVLTPIVVGTIASRGRDGSSMVLWWHAYRDEELIAESKYRSL